MIKKMILITSVIFLEVRLNINARVGSFASTKVLKMDDLCDKKGGNHNYIFISRPRLAIRSKK